MGEWTAPPRGRPGPPHGPRARDRRSAPATWAGWWTRSATPSTAGAPSRSRARRQIDIVAPGIVKRQPVKEPLQTGAQGHRLHDPHRAGPARADHRRPGHREDGGGSRHHHQPEGHATSSASTAPSASGRGRWRNVVETLRERGAHGLHHRGGRQRLGPGPHAVHRALRRLALAEHFMWQGKHTLVDLRRPLQAGPRVPPALAGAAPAPGPRGVPGRRVLPPLPAAGAGLQAVRRAWAAAR